MSARKKKYAERLWRFTEQSNAIHEQYLSDPELLQQYEYFLEWQVAYSLPFYREFEEDPRSAAAVEFVISDLIGTGISARDADLARVIPIMIRLLPANALRTLASAMELNARALGINLEICQHLFEMVDISEGISERDYCIAFRQSTSLDECKELIELIISLGRSLQRMVRSTTLGMTLRAMHYPAHAAGFGALQDFLEKGYTTFHALKEVDDFLERFAVRIDDMLTRACTGPLPVMQSGSAKGPRQA